EYVDLMAKLNLPNPKMMDVAVPANMKVGLVQEEIARRGWAFTAKQALELVERPDVAVVELPAGGAAGKPGGNSPSLPLAFPLVAAALPDAAAKLPCRRDVERAG